MRVSAKTLQGGWVEGVGHQVKKKRNPEVHNKKKKSTPLNETIIHETHLQLHQVQTNNHEPWREMQRKLKMEGGVILYWLFYCLLEVWAWEENTTSVPGWWGWLVISGLWYLAYLIRDIYLYVYIHFFLEINCISPRTYLVRIKNYGCMFIEWSVNHNRNRVRVRTCHVVSTNIEICY